MVIFFNDTPLYLIDRIKTPDASHFQVHVDVTEEELITEKLIHNVLVTGAGKKDINRIIEMLEHNVFNQVSSITIAVKDYAVAKTHFKTNYKISHAAGGIVRKGDKVLMIYRLKKWDLPKGKIDSGETSKEAAVREVEEETRVKVKMGKKICNTWHTYSLNGRRILKKTRWYTMDCVDDSKMAPQKSEDIEDVKWLKTKDLYHGLMDSYGSIRYVFERYKKKLGKKSIL